MKKILFAFAVAIALTGLSASVKADILTFTTTLSGANGAAGRFPRYWHRNSHRGHCP